MNIMIIGLVASGLSSIAFVMGTYAVFAEVSVEYPSDHKNRRWGAVIMTVSSFSLGFLIHTFMSM